MDHYRAEQDLKFIKRTMKASLRYTNIPPLGYLFAGLLGLAGPLLSYYLIGSQKARELNLLSVQDLTLLSLLWAGIFLAALAAAIICSVLRAKRRKKRAWNSLTARMVLSQLPQLLAAGILTLALALAGQFRLIPGLWLLSWALVLFSFYYFTGTELLIQSFLFILLAVLALFAPKLSPLFLLGAGFGAVHLLYGIKGLITERNNHETGTAE